MPLGISGITLDASALLKWELALILVSCFVITLLYAALGIRFSSLKESYTQKILLMAFIFSVIKIIFCFTVFKWIEDGVFLGAATIDLAINLIWSPLLPLCVIWLYLAHATKSCNSCEMAVPTKNVRTLPRPTRVFAYTMAGISTTCLLSLSGHLCARNVNTIIAIVSTIALVGCAVEIIYFKAHDNIVRLASTTWCWFAGTWLGALLIYLL